MENNPNLQDNQRVNVFREIWLSPRRTFSFIIETHYEKYFSLLLILYGIQKTLDRAVTKSMGDNLPLISVLLFCIFLGGALGWIFFYLYAAMISWTGTFIGGTADTRSVLRIMSYASIPSICGLVVIVIQVALYGNAIFQSDKLIAFDTQSGRYLFLAMYAVELFLSVWSLVLCVVGIAQLQKFPVWKAILNFLMPFLALMICVWALFSFFSLLN